MNNKNTTVTGTTADLKAKVDIAKVHGGYFSNQEVAQAFIEIGINKIMTDLRPPLTYCDFGGGKGFLANLVRNHLTSHGITCNSFVLDANETFLISARELGLQTILCDLTNVNITSANLITMRAVNHYNSIEKQKEILRTAHTSLKTNGYVISQISSGNQANCELRSKIVNLESLERASSRESYHWTSIEEYCELLNIARFKNIAVLGYAPSCSWTPEEQWSRFHDQETQVAEEQQNKNKLKRLAEQKQLFLTQAYAIIKEYAKKHTPQHLGLSYNDKGETVINYEYPIIVCQK